MQNALRYCAGSQACTPDSFSQNQRFTGSWVNHPTDSFNGFYTMSNDCPGWARDYDCKNPQLTGGALRPILLVLPMFTRLAL